MVVLGEMGGLGKRKGKKKIVGIHGRKKISPLEPQGGFLLLEGGGVGEISKRKGGVWLLRKVEVFRRKVIFGSGRGRNECSQKGKSRKEFCA